VVFLLMRSILLAMWSKTLTSALMSLGTRWVAWRTTYDKGSWGNSLIFINIFVSYKIWIIERVKIYFSLFFGYYPATWCKCVWRNTLNTCIKKNKKTMKMVKKFFSNAQVNLKMKYSLKCTKKCWSPEKNLGSTSPKSFWQNSLRKWKKAD